MDLVICSTKLGRTSIMKLKLIIMILEMINMRNYGNIMKDNSETISDMATECCIL